MRGLWLDRQGARLREDLERPAARPAEVRVRVLTAGVCATDLALASGYMGFEGVPGHEFVGVALEGPWAGRRVVGEINAACGACAACDSGLDRHCPERTVLGILGRPGAFAEELALPARNLLPVPDEISDERAVFTEPLAAALAIGEQVELRAGARALVAGDGRLGLLCAQVLQASGLEVTLAGRHRERARRVAPEMRFVEGWLEEGAAPPPRPEFDLAVEATGDPAVLGRLLVHIRPRGTLVLKTTQEHASRVDLAGVVVNEQRIVGSRCGRFAPALEWLSERRVNVDPMIEARYPLQYAERALEHARGALKILIDIDSAP